MSSEVCPRIQLRYQQLFWHGSFLYDDDWKEAAAGGSCCCDCSPGSWAILRPADKRRPYPTKLRYREPSPKEISKMTGSFSIAVWTNYDQAFPLKGAVGNGWPCLGQQHYLHSSGPHRLQSKGRSLGKFQVEQSQNGQVANGWCSYYCPPAQERGVLKGNLEGPRRRGGKNWQLVDDHHPLIPDPFLFQAL